MSTYQDKIYVGDIGTEIILDTGVDLSSATSLKIAVKKGDGSVGEWAATIFETTKVKHVSADGDLNVSGLYSFQAKIVTPSWSGLGSTATVRVYEPFK